MTLGEVAYERWRALHEYPLREWAALSKHVKAVWQEVAWAVTEAKNSKRPKE